MNGAIGSSKVEENGSCLELLLKAVFDVCRQCCDLVACTAAATKLCLFRAKKFLDRR